MPTTDKINRVITGLRVVLVLVALAFALAGVIAVIWIVWRGSSK